MALLEKHLNILDYTLAGLWRKKGKNAAVVTVFAAVIFMLASFQLVGSALTAFSRNVLLTAPEITVQRLVAGRQESLPLAYAEKLRRIYGIREIAPRIWGYYFDERNGANYTVQGMDPAAATARTLAASLGSGRFLPGEAAGEVVLGQGVAEALDLQGRTVFSFFRPDLSLKSLVVTGGFSPASAMLTHDLVAMSLADARDLFRLPADQATDLLVSVANPKEIANIAKKIAEQLPDCRVLTRNQIQKTYQVIFGWRSGFASICLLTALAAFVILSWDKASGMSPEEKREIGILKILGWETADVLASRFWEGFILAAVAFLVGFLLAYAHVLYFDASLFAPMLIGWSVIKPPLHLVPQVHLADILLLASFSVLPYLAATVIPAWRSAAIPPESAVR
ncbi:MAG: ABC transporter permease [Thermodesulfobacteriota bacterium]